MQTCSKCQIEKELDEFYPSKAKNIKNSKKRRFYAKNPNIKIKT